MLREHKEVKDCVARGSHHGLTPCSATCPMLRAHQAGQGQQQQGCSLGGHKTLLSHFRNDTLGAASLWTRQGRGLAAVAHRSEHPVQQKHIRQLKPG